MMSEPYCVMWHLWWNINDCMMGYIRNCKTWRPGWLLLSLSWVGLWKPAVMTWANERQASTASFDVPVQSLVILNYISPFLRFTLKPSWPLKEQQFPAYKQLLQEKLLDLELATSCFWVKGGRNKEEKIHRASIKKSCSSQAERKNLQRDMKVSETLVNGV